MKKKLLILLILLVGVLPVSGVNEPAIAYYNMSDPATSPVPIWSDSIGTENILVSCSNNGKYIVAGSNSGIFRMYDNTGKILWTYKDPTKSVTSVSIAGTGEYAAAAFYRPYPDDGGVFWFNRNGTGLWKYSQLSEQRNNVAISGNGSVTAISIEKDLNLIDKSGQIMSNTTMPYDICRIAISDDGSTSVVASTSHCPWRGVSGAISGVDSNGRILFVYPIERSFIDIGVSGNGERIVGVDENQLYAFGRNGTLLWNYSGYPQFRSVTVSSDGQYVSAGSQYYVWDFNRTGSLLWKYYDPKGWFNAVSVSGDGQVIVAGSSNKVLLLNRTGALLWEYPASSDVTSVSASRDGNYFAAGTKHEVYFFNRWGNTTIIDERQVAIDSVPFDGSSKTQPKTTPATQSAPLADFFAILATGTCALIKMKFRIRR